MIRARAGLRVAASFCVLTIGALVMLAVAIPTLGLARRFYSETIGRWIGRTLLRMSGVRYRTHGAAAPPDRQTIYISNHASTLDVFILIALALPRTRFFLSGFLRKVVPVGIIGTLIRIFWTVPQEYPIKRRLIFKRADRILRQTGDSVYLSPEGMRVTTGEIGAFNKGAFHLATSLHAQILPIYIAIPREIDPGMGYDAKPGTTDIYFLPPIDTSAWRLVDLDENRRAVRDLFVRVHESMKRTGRLPADLSVANTEPIPEAVLA
jgi:putative phosphoserine phosphatase/1-acylglycerol-3-phosphate O-acyltransferase